MAVEHHRRRRPTGRAAGMSVMTTAVGIMALTFTHSAQAGPPPPPDPIVPQPKMGEPLHGLTPLQQLRFDNGQIEYNTPLTEAEGLGPIFNKESCGNCHNAPLGGHGTQTVTRFGRVDKGVFDPLAEYGGSLLQSQSTDPENCGEEIPPEALAPGGVTAFRITTGMLGYGLVEAIADADLLFNADPNDDDGNGISGVAHMTLAFEDFGGPPRVGRFGHKAQLPTILSFSADASREEMGFTNRFIQLENDPNGIRKPLVTDCDDVADPEDPKDAEGLYFIDRVTFFQRYLAGPPQTPKSGMPGEAIFMQIGCNKCHTPAFTTRDGAMLEEVLRLQPIRPYSDFLLHDMGQSADFIAQGDATAREMRTPTLWGMASRDPLWHDGRFAGDTFENRVTAAIIAHGALGSEARTANIVRDDGLGEWNLLSQDDKDALVAFLATLGQAEFDSDNDNDVDLVDFHAFTLCFTQGGKVMPEDACAISDVDQDGDVDLDDFESFLLAYDGELADCNENGQPDLQDILLGTSVDADLDGIPDECQVACVGDIDEDGEVDFDDFTALLAAWGPCKGCPADLDENGEVDFDDFTLLLASWGSCP